jgi:hypothetical protein
MPYVADFHEQRRRIFFLDAGARVEHAVVHQQNVRVARVLRFFRDVHFELAEARAEVEKLLLGQLLAAHDDHDVVEKGLVDRAKCRVVELAHVDPGNFRADFRRCTPHFEHECSP